MNLIVARHTLQSRPPKRLVELTVYQVATMLALTVLVAIWL